MSKLMKKISNEAYGKDIKGEMFSIGNTFLTKRKVSTHEAIKRVLALPMRHLNIDVLYVSSGLKNNRTRMVKSLSILEETHPNVTNILECNIIDKYENRLDNLHSMCLGDIGSSYVTKKADDLPIEPVEIKSYTVSLSNIDDVKLNSNMIVLKNEIGEVWKRSWPCVTHFYKVSKLKSQEEYYLRLLQLYKPWRNENEMKQDNQSYEDRNKGVEGDILCNIKKHEPCLDIVIYNIYSIYTYTIVYIVYIYIYIYIVYIYIV